ncbi:MAG TPA: RHS repeat-associated core domain-containing protein [Thermoanaerobaculia bacterium]|nr:RHS repeat-associated core domain-containing protein [Thermoanaerobaculia bacterium]
MDAATNRLSTPYAYDARGNLTSTGTLTYSWDYSDRMTRGNEGTTPYDYAYTAENERILRAPQSGSATFTLRDAEKRVVTELVGATPTPTLSRDNAFLGNLLVASWSNTAVSGNQWPWSFYSSDHLGTPRLLTGLAGEQQETRKYWPYGEDANTQTTPQRLRFATMERDPEGPRYYDHARHHDTGLARFTSPDVLGGKPGDPQSWNRYAYARSNPLKYVDPDGLTIWSTTWRVAAFLRREGKAVAHISEATRNKVLARITHALDSIERTDGVKRVLIAETPEARDAVARQLSTNGKARAIQRHGSFPDHVHPAEGPYVDVHIQTEADTKAAGLGKGFLAIVAPFSSSIDANQDASPGEIASSALWDIAKAIDPFFLTDLIEHVMGLDELSSQKKQREDEAGRKQE